VLVGLTGIKRNRALGMAALLLFYASLASVAARSAFNGSGTNALAGGVGGAQEQTGAGGAAADASGGAGTGAPGQAAAAAGAASPAGTTAGTAGSAAAASKAAAAAAAADAAHSAILIGVHDDDPGPAYKAYGVNAQPGSQEQWVTKIVDWINGHGGMGGRPLAIVPHVTQNLNGTFDQQAQDACTDFTEDHHVVAVVAAAKVPTFNEPDCLAAHRTPLVWEFEDMAMASDYSRYGPYLYQPAMPTGDRLGIWIDAVADRGFFNGGKIGILRYDTQQSVVLENSVIRPRLAAHGLTVTDTFAFNNGTAASDAADLSAQANSAILRFRSEGINRIIFEPSTNIIPLLFITAAKANSYFPKYTWSGFDSAYFEQPNAGADQLEGTLVFGWQPASDVDPTQRPGESPAAQLCVEITNGAQPPGNSSVRRFCDGLFFLKALFDHGAQPTPESMQATAQNLGGSWDSPFTLHATFGPGRQDGASVGRLVGYDTGCSCFKWVSGDIPIP
jgi:hypothetical protein